MQIKQLRELARQKLMPTCRVCPVCDGRACRGETPGMGGIGTGRSFMNNISALQNIKLNMRATHNVTKVNTNCKLLGLDLSMPVLGAPIGGIFGNVNNIMSDPEFQDIMLQAFAKAGSIAIVPATPDMDVYTGVLSALNKAKGHGMINIKPFANERIIELAKKAEQAAAKAIVVDIDAIGLLSIVSSNPINLSGKTVKDLRLLKKSINLPLIIKGIMTPECALSCVEAGVDGIIVGNHGGRVLDDVPGAVEILPAIKTAVADRILILADGGVRTGVDVFKMLALGAHAVLIGRPQAIGACGGVPGMELLLEKIQRELSATMIMTGCATLKDIEPRVLFQDK